jgi:hypothetical protein
MSLRSVVITLGVGSVLWGCRDDRMAPEIPPPGASAVRPTAVASQYYPEFVATAATGVAMNNAGDVVGTSYIDNGCGPFCLPPQEVAVWKGGNRIPLPLVPGYTSSYNFPTFINNQGLIGGVAGIPGSSTRAAVWTPSGGGYVVQDLGVFPGATSADVYGLDDLGRMVGWSTAGGAIPTFAVPFMWTQAGGFVNLAAQGYPNEIPGGMSPGGKVVTRSGHWYQLGNPGSVVTNPPPPQSFFGFGSGIINDNGDQAHFLGTGTQGLIYPFRLSNGVWQQISSIPTGHLSRAGLGSINLAQDISFTAGSTGLIAAGPNGVGQPLASLISPAYPGATVGLGGPMNAAGQILTQVMIGRSQRLMRLTPTTPCGANCLVVSSLVMTGQFVQDPAFPGSCFQGGSMFNRSTATVTVTSEAGAPLAGVQVRGRFLDDYWTDHQVVGTTNASGMVSWTDTGPCGVGAIAFLVDQATLSSRTLDRTRGTLTAWVIPSVNPPPNQAPVAVAAVTCANLLCTFDARGSTDDVGVTAYEWRRTNGTLLSTQSLWTRQFTRGGPVTVVLTVFDGGGLSGSQSVTFDPAGPPPPPNQAPVSAPVVTCVAGRSCTFDGSGSFDPDGSVVGYRWYRSNGTTVSTQAVFTRTFNAPGQSSIILAVTDNGGLTTSKSVSFTILP